MGWCSGTDVFDKMCEYIIERSLASEFDKINVLKILIETLEDNDWDCQSDSAYWTCPIIRLIFKEIHPDWDYDE